MVFSVNDYSKLAAIKLGDPPSVLWESEDYLSDIPSPVAIGNLLILPTSYGVVACYDATSGEVLWEYEIDNSIYASPVISENKVYMVDKEGITHIYEAGSEFVLIGKPEIGEKVVCTPAFTNGRIYMRGYDHLYAIGE
jgi:outer membrane protein assembly factor BamB